MEQEFDLQPYLSALLRNWYWIAGAALAAAAIAFLVSSVLPPTYATTALVAITNPQERIQFDPRFETINDERPLQAYPELATSDELLQTLLEHLNPPIDDIHSIEDLRQTISAEPGKDPSLLRLKASLGDAEDSARLANSWAELFVRWANDIFGDQNSNQLAFFESQLVQARADLEASEEALVDFQSENRTAILTNELDALKLTQASYLDDTRALAFLIQDIQDLRSQIASQNSGSAVTFADQLTALLLQIEAFGADMTSPLQVDASTTGILTTADRREQLAALDGLLITLNERLDTTARRLLELEPQLLETQRQLQEIQTEQTRLTRDVEVYTETYTALARKVEEERISSQDLSSGVRLASKAAVPRKPVGPQRLINTAVAAVLGLAVGALGVLVVSWWRD